MKLDDIIKAIIAERKRQEQLQRAGKFSFTCASTTPTNNEKLAILTEEYGENAREVCEMNYRFHPKISFKKIKKHRLNLKKKLIQTAAVCVAWLESMEDDL